MSQGESPASGDRAAAIFESALALDVAARQSYLDRACSGDAALRRRAEALLRAHADATEFLPETPAPIPMNRPTTPRVIGDYEILDEIDRGGMGVVYRARQRSLGRVVALKMLPLAQFSDPDSILRLREEAATAAALQHPNIVAIHEVGEHEGQPYYSMDYIEGRNLAALVRDQPLPARQAAGWLRSIAEAVEYAHGRGIFHRDLKPSNVLIDPFGQPRITDFGLAKRLPRQGEPATAAASRATAHPASDVTLGLPATEQTLPGQILGSPNYLAPELASARPGATGPTSEVYSLGAILFHLLTSRPPFQAETIGEVLHQVRNVDPPSPRLLNASVPRALETICLKCLSKQPAGRYPSAQALADDLGRFLRGEPIQARPAGALVRLRHWSRRHPGRAAAVVALAAVAVASTWTTLHLQHLNREIRLNLYVQDMNVALRAWSEGNRPQAFELLQRHRPGDGETDLRGFEWRYLWSLCRGNYTQALPVHRQVVGTMKFSPDGQFLATYSWDGVVRLWQRNTRTLLLTIPGVSGLGGFSTDGQQLLVGRKDLSLELLDVRTGLSVRSIPHAGELAAFAPRQSSVAVVTAANVLRVLHVPDGAPRLSVPGLLGRRIDYGWGESIALSPDGRWLALRQRSPQPLHPDASIRLWDLNSGQELPPLPENRQLRCLEFSPDSTRLAAGDGDGAVKLWQLSTRTFIRIQAHENPVLALAFSPEGERLATGSTDPHNIRLWNVRDGESLPATLSGHLGDAWSLAFSPDGKQLASAGRDSPIRVWNCDEHAASEIVPSRIRADEYGNFCFSPDGRWMAGGCVDGTVKVWEVATLMVRGILRNTAYVAVFSRDSRELLTATQEGTASWWNFETQARRPIPGYAGALARVVSVDLSRDRRTAALGLANGEIQILDIDSGKSLGPPLRGHVGPVHSVSFSPSGDQLASGGGDKAVMLWDVASHRGLGMCTEHKGAVFGVAISPDGQTLASGCGAEAIKLWALPSFSTGSLASITYHSSVIRTLAFSPDGRTLASGSEDKSVKFWNLATRREVASFKYESKVRLVAFSPDGNALAIITDSGTLRILRASSLAAVEQEWLSLWR